MYICRERYQNGGLRNCHIIGELFHEMQKLTEAAENLR